MNIPVLIAARNESEKIGRTLESLDKGVEPIVIVNACTDDGRTEAIARSFGAVTVLESQPGKMRALQRGVEYLGDRATDPFITLDADTKPLFSSKQWASGLVASRNQLDPNKPAVISGPLIFRDMSLPAAIWRNAANAKMQLATRTDVDGIFNGSNMLIDLRDKSVRDEFLSMPNIWPCEDIAIKDLIVENDGNTLKSINPKALALTDYDRYPGIMFRFSQGQDACRDAIHDSYVNDTPEGGIHYREYQAQQKGEQTNTPEPQIGVIA